MAKKDQNHVMVLLLRIHLHVIHRCDSKVEHEESTLIGCAIEVFWARRSFVLGRFDLIKYHGPPGLFLSAQCLCDLRKPCWDPTLFFSMLSRFV